jgi:hypothetical protein
MEWWNIGFLFHLIAIEKHHDSWDKQIMDRKNINRGFKKLRVWQDAVSLYILAYKVFANFPFELKKVAANCIDASHSISRNISEGYCRRPPEEEKSIWII